MRRFFSPLSIMSSNSCIKPPNPIATIILRGEQRRLQGEPCTAGMQNSFPVMWTSKTTLTKSRQLIMKIWETPWELIRKHPSGRWMLNLGQEQATSFDGSLNSYRNGYPMDCEVANFVHLLKQVAICLLASKMSLCLITLLNRVLLIGGGRGYKCLGRQKFPSPIYSKLV